LSSVTWGEFCGFRGGFPNFTRISFNISDLTLTNIDQWGVLKSTITG
jgi:hypothetical protein